MRQIRVVLIGGGIGLLVMAKGLGEFPIDITVIMIIADNGGNIRKTRDGMDISAPGDVRNAVAALSDSESVLSQLLQYRFEENQISGHSLGNLLTAGMTNITNDFGHAIRALGKILDIKGRVIPPTNINVRLNTVMEDEEVIFGGTNIPKEHKKIDRMFLEPNDVRPMEETTDALREADLIVLGSGSLYASIISNLCVNGISDALTRPDTSKLYISNVIAQPGEADGYSVRNHIDATHRRARQLFIDYVICNTQAFNARVLKKYEKKHSKPVEVDRVELEKGSIDVRTSFNLVEISENHLVRHNAKVLSTMTYGIALELISVIPFVLNDKCKQYRA